MKGWVGFGLALAAIVLALFLNPHDILNAEASIHSRVGLASIFLCMACAAFLLGNETSELDFSRELAIWTAGIVVVVVAAINFDLIWKNDGANEAVVAKNQPPAKTDKRKKKNADVYVPDTAPINRVERIVTRQSIDPLAENDKVRVKNHVTKKDTKLDPGFKISDEEKERFRKFLKAQGLKYDPKTAFQIEPPERPGEAD